MPPDQPHPRTHLFMVRLWIEPFANSLGEVRMQVQHILSGGLLDALVTLPLVFPPLALGFFLW